MHDIESKKTGPKSIALPMYINQLFFQMLKDFENYDRRMLSKHKLKATFIRKKMKEFVDEIEFLSSPNTKVYYETYHYLVMRKSKNRQELKERLDI